MTDPSGRGSSPLSRLEETLLRHHYTRPPLWTYGLLPVEWLFRTLVGCRLTAYRRGWAKAARVGVPVISIGNITVSGTGKTPVIKALAEHLLAAGLRVAILARGYASQSDQSQPVTDPSHGDEPFFLQESLPQALVMVGRNRRESARLAIQTYRPDVILLDDGFQHLRLARTFDIVLVHGDRLFGNGHMMPIGPLREPLHHIRRADAIWVTRSSDPNVRTQVEDLVRRHARVSVPVHLVPFEADTLVNVGSGESMPADRLGRACILMSGVSWPDGFDQDVRRQGIEVLRHFRFEDHAAYSPRDVQRVLAARPSDDTPLITTDKDRVKLEPLLPAATRRHVYVLTLRPVLPDLGEILAALSQRRTGE